MALQIRTQVNTKVEQIVTHKLPGREVYCSYHNNSSKKAHKKRFIQVQTAFPNRESVHYEYICGHWELHIEPPRESDGYRYGRIVRYIKEHINGSPLLIWRNEGWRDIAIYQEEVCNNEQLEKILIELSNIFDNVLAECAEIFKPLDLSEQYVQKGELQKLDVESEVSLKTLSMREVFDLPLIIPEYQRIYCWEDKNISTLWNNLLEMPEGQSYHLGAIILQNGNVRKSV